MRGRNERGDRGDLAGRPEWRADSHQAVAAAGAADGGGRFALPPELTDQSIALPRIVLPLDAALRAIQSALEQGVRLESWEGCVKLHSGSRVRSLEHGGSFALPPDAARAATVATDAMRRAQARFDRDPEFPDATLYFGLTFAA